MKNSKLSILLRGIIAENPVLILILGTCPTLAVTGNITSALSMGLGFILALFLMAFIREVFGAGTFMGIELGFMKNFCIPVLAGAPGGFLVYGILIAIMNKLTEKKGGVKKKSFSCEGCPSASVCVSKSCMNNEKKEEVENA